MKKLLILVFLLSSCATTAPSHSIKDIKRLQVLNGCLRSCEESRKYCTDNSSSWDSCWIMSEDCQERCRDEIRPE